MPKYHMYAKVDAAIYLGVVEADSEAEAAERAIALDSYHRPGLCHHCSHKIDVGHLSEPFNGDDGGSSQEG